MGTWPEGFTSKEVPHSSILGLCRGSFVVFLRSHLSSEEGVHLEQWRREVDGLHVSHCEIPVLATRADVGHREAGEAS